MIDSYLDHVVITSDNTNVYAIMYSEDAVCDTNISAIAIRIS